MPRRHPFDQTSIDQMIAQALAETPPDDPEALAPLSFDAGANPEATPAAVEKPGATNFRKFGLPAWAVGTAADLFSTHQALGRPGLAEGNPIYGGMGRGKLVATNAAISALLGLLLDKAAKNSPQFDKVATGIGLGGGAMRGGLAVRNHGMGR